MLFALKTLKLYGCWPISPMLFGGDVEFRCLKEIDIESSDDDGYDDNDDGEEDGEENDEEDYDDGIDDDYDENDDDDDYDVEENEDVVHNRLI